MGDAKHNGVAIHLDQLDVVDIFEVPHPSAKIWGTDSVYKTVDGLLLRDGTKRYGCKSCKETYGTPIGVCSHQRRDHLDGAKTAGTAKAAQKPAKRARPARVEQAPAAPAEAASGPVKPARGTAVVVPVKAGDPEARMDQTVELVAKLSDSRNEWRKRAEAAERELARLRAGIAKLAGEVPPGA